MTMRQVSWLAAVILAVSGIFSWIQSNVVAPQLALAFEKRLGEVTSSVVSRPELQSLVLDRLAQLATREQVDGIVQRLDRMDARLRELERR